MRRSGRGGSVVNIITMASHGGEPVLTAYAASKGALAIFTRNAGYSLQPDRIRVNGLNIGWTATDGEHLVQTADRAARRLARAGRREPPAGAPAAPRTTSPRWSRTCSATPPQMITGSVIDFDQTVLGPYGEHVAAVAA